MIQSELEVHEEGVRRVREVYGHEFINPGTVFSDHVFNGMKIRQKTELYPPKNIFIETISKEHLNILGGPWEAFAQGNQLEMHYFMGHGTLCWFMLNQTVLSNLNTWLPMVGRRHVIRNEGWNTIGYTVPLTTFPSIVGQSNFQIWKVEGM